MARPDNKPKFAHANPRRPELDTDNEFDRVSDEARITHRTTHVHPAEGLFDTGYSACQLLDGPTRLQTKPIPKIQSST